MSVPKKKLIVPSLVSRNPFVAAAKMRRAGSHRQSIKTERQLSAREMRQQLSKIKIPVDDGDFLLRF